MGNRRSGQNKNTFVTIIADYSTAICSVFLLLGLIACSGPKVLPPSTPAQKLSAEGVRRLERGDYSGALEMFKQTLQEAELVDDLQGQAMGWNNLGLLSLAQGDLPGAVMAHGHAVRYYRKTKDAPGEMRARVNLGVVLVETGDFNVAKQQLVAAQQLGENLGKPREWWLAEVALANIEIRTGQVQQGVERAKNARGWAENRHDVAIESAAHLVEGSGFFALNDLDKALPSYEFALSLDRKRQEPTAILEDLRAIAEVYIRRDQRDLAADALGRRGRVAKRLGRLDVAEQDMAHALELGAGAMQVDDLNALKIEYDAIRQVKATTRRPNKSE